MVEKLQKIRFSTNDEKDCEPQAPQLGTAANVPNCCQVKRLEYKSPVDVARESRQ